jgi:two-component system, cell cycle response regulator
VRTRSAAAPSAGRDLGRPADRSLDSGACPEVLSFALGATVTWDEITSVSAVPAEVGKISPKRDQAYLIVLAGNSMGEMFKLTRDRTVIGRGQKADIRMMDEGLSREHCEVVLEGDKIFLRDLGSTNGTYCRGVRVDRHELADGDKILVGSGTVLKFTFHDKLDETFQRQMYESALRDDLTKAFNKKYFLDRLESEYAYAIRHNVPLALISFDIDHFKDINDTHGHLAGDKVLAELATAVLAAVRVEDVFARVGGEEFSVICRGADLLQGQIVGERLRLTVENRRFEYDNRTIPVTISVGVAAVPHTSVRDATGFIEAADQLLYEAKRSGRNRVCIWKKS